MNQAKELVALTHFLLKHETHTSLCFSDKDLKGHYLMNNVMACLFTGRLSMSLVMEYLPYGSLIGYLEKNKHNVNTRRMLLFASQICKVRELAKC